MKTRENPLRRLYHWVLGWADRPGGPWALAGIATAESFIFPIPPDVLLIPLALAKPKRAFWFAALCTLGSVAGGMLGYLIGSVLFEAVGGPILHFYNGTEAFEALGRAFDENLVFALGAAGFTPIPYKVFTVAVAVAVVAGFFLIRPLID